MTTTISKSKYVTGLQCSKLLWIHYNDSKALPAPDDGKLATFKTGHMVGDMAKDLYPEGEEVEWSRDLSKTTRETQELLRRRIPIFEASFETNGCYCRADIMVPSGDDAWDLFEVKSATKVKGVNIDDVSFQTDVIERSGVKLDRLYLMHLDSKYVRQGPVDTQGLFFASDVTDKARSLQSAVDAKVRQMHQCIAGDRPDTPIGEHCFKPYPCDLWSVCSSHLPEHPVLELNGIRKRKAFKLIDDGVTSITELPVVDLSDKHLIQRNAIVERTPQVMQSEIRGFLDGLEYPLYCLDFEAMNPAVPRFDGTRSYQHIPFQLSLHVIDQKGDEPKHVEYLAETAGDPRPGLIDALRAIGPSGTVLAFNMSYEKRIIRELARDFPDEDAFLMGLHNRFEDLAAPFSRFWYYDARQRGSSSLKAVLPVLTGTTYKGMEIEEGGQAMREFQRVMFEDTEPKVRERVLVALREYCRQDTQAMIDILTVLENV